MTGALKAVWDRLSRAGAIVRATYRGAREDDLAGEAAKMAYFFFLSLFPLILVIFSLTGIVGGEAAFNRITQVAETAVPQHAWQFVSEVITEIRERERPGVLSLGILLTLWAASNGIAALTRGLNTMYDVEDARPWWRRRVLALGVLAASVVLIVVGATLFVPGMSWLRDVQLDAAWRWGRWPIAAALLVGLVWLAFRHLPARDQRSAWRETLVGAIVASAVWILATLLFRVYITNFGRYGRTYGAVGAVIVLLIWFYISGLAVLVGGELAATLEARERAGRSRDGGGSGESSQRNQEHKASLPGS